MRIKNSELLRRKRIGKSHLGKKLSISTRKKISRTAKRNGVGKWMLGRKASIKTRNKMSKYRKKNPINYWLGKKFSVKHKKKISESQIRIGNIPPSNLGKFRSKETRTKLSNLKKGKLNPCWKGGISFINYTINWTSILRESIRKRDGYVCKLCGKFQKKLNFAVHHIDYNKRNCNPNNLITLCHSCHSKTNHKNNYWKQYFKKL